MNHSALTKPSRRDALQAGVGLLALAAGMDGHAQAQTAQTTPIATTPSVAEMERTAPNLPALGATLALPSTPLLGGGEFRAPQAAGQVTVIYWWASTCPFCAQQSPEMQKLWQAWQGQGLQFLALSVDKKPQDALTYLQKKGYTFPSAWVSPEVHKVLPKPKGLPITVVLGRDGRVLQAEKGQMFAEDVAQLVQWLK